jgi:hypothetical protein
MEHLYELLSSDNDWVKQRAELAIQFTEQYQRGEMDKSEFDELMLDLIRTDEVMENASSMEAKAKLESAITLIVSAI